MIVILSGAKGGVGKTTTAINLAVAIQKSGASVCIVDADNDNANATEFCFFRNQNEKVDNIACLSKEGNISHDILDLNKHYDYIVVDTKGGASRELRTGAKVADILITPFEPEQFSLSSCELMSDLLEQFIDDNEKLVPIAFINKVSTNPREISDYNDAYLFLKEKSSYRVLEKFLYKRKFYTQIISQGLGVVECQDDTKPCIEFNTIYSDIFKMYNYILNHDKQKVENV